MKNVLIIALFMLVIAPISPAKGAKSEDEQKVVIIPVKKGGQSSDRDRMLDYYIDVYYDSDSGVVSFDLFGIGIADVNLINELGMVINSVTVDANLPTSFSLYTGNDSGVIRVEIDTPTIYAEGIIYK